jgi:hypothetical protein
LQDGGNSVAPAKRASGDSRAFSLTMTAVKAKGSQMTATLPESSAASKFDRFYVYQTTSKQQSA